jgi:hypothetical protein
VNSLKPLRHTTKLMNDFYVFDSETGIKKGNFIHWSLTGKFIFGVIYGYNYTKVIHSKQELIDEFKNPRYKGKKVFAHNAEFDLTILFDNIYKVFPDAIFNGKFISCSNGNCTFADSLNIYRSSAKVIGEMLGMPKTMSYDKTNWSDKKQKAKAINGCIRDCEIIWEALFRIFEKVGSIKITQASLSLDYFKRYFLDHVIEHNENTPFFFDSYFGGRTEAFRIGKVNGKVIDVNSMYPWGMKFAKFPNPKFLRVEKNVTPSKFKKYFLKNFEGCVYCTVEHKNTWIGYLPVKSGGKLLFPTGTFSGCWNFNEIKFAIDSGAVEIKHISKVVYAPAMDSPFKHYVDTLYKQRFESDNEFHIYVIKIFMNSLYGKFAQNIKEEWLYIDDMERQIDVINAYELKNKLINIVPFNESRKDCFLVIGSDNNWTKDFSIPSFASYITSYCRVHLLKKMLEIGSKKVLYCDTDSIFFEGINKFKDEKELGGWKLENKKITEIKGLKNYRYIYKDKKTGKWVKQRKIKGVPYNAIEFKKHKYRYVNLLKTKEALRRGLNAGTEIERIKVIKNTYDKRIILKSGFTKPIKF